MLRAIRYLILVSLLLLGNTTRAQNEKYTSLTIKDGLPSNYIYRTLEDNQGFLWVATNAGLARYDGKRFQIYTKKDGLPENEVISIVKEKNGRIWVVCLKQDPAYFDELKNRFVCPVDKKKLASMTSTLNMYLYALPNGGVMYGNAAGNFVFINKKLIEYNDFKPDMRFGLIKRNKDGSEIRTGSRLGKGHKRLVFGFYQTKNKRILDSNLIFRKPPHDYGAGALDDEKYYLINAALSKCYIYSDFQTNPVRYKKDSLTIPEPFINLLFTPTSFYFVANSGKIYVYNKFTRKLTAVVSGNYLPNSFYDDSKGNQWVSTIDKGLILYRRSPLQQIQMPNDYFRTNFLSITKSNSGATFAGNYYGEVFEANKGGRTIHGITKMVTSRIRKILVSGNDVYTFSEQGTYYNYKNPIIDPRVNQIHRSKTALILNDSTIVIGTHFALDALNTRTKKLKNLSPKNIRITALAKADQNTIYFGSLNGVSKYNVLNDTFSNLNHISDILNDKITALCYTADSILWVSTAANGIFALKNDKIIPGSVFLKDQYRSIISSGIGRLWAASPNGITILNYKLNGHAITYTTSNLTTSDGLVSNDVQDLIHHSGLVYAATTNGISVIPQDFKVPKVDIPTYLTHLSVNQKDTILAKHYVLKYPEKSIQMHFAGVDLGGHFKHLQYTLNKNANWVKLEENTLSLQLTSGEHLLQVRAVDISGNVSTQILSISFTVATPFWKNIWFWVIVVLIFQILIIYVINKRQRRRKEFRLAKKIAAVQTAELEQQAFAALMSPHFIFNALNSIQHYINVQDRQSANRYLSDFASLIRQNFEAAHHSFVPLEEEIENIKLYLNLEQMRFSNQFDYKIKIDRELDVEDWMIPSMILQPLLENALLHGIMPSSIAGKVRVQFNLRNKDLVIVVTDNGIGLSNSEALKTNTTHKSRGMALINKRIKALNSFDSEPITIHMEPAYNSTKNPGNRISFLIPFALHSAWMKAKHS